MTEQEFYALVGLPGAGAIESLTLEFKQELDQPPYTDRQGNAIPPNSLEHEDRDKEIVRDLTQFANGDGGFLVVGVAEARQGQGARGQLHRASAILGQADPQQAVRRIEQMINNHCTERDWRPSIAPVEVTATNGGRVHVIVATIEPRERLLGLWSRNKQIEVYTRTNDGKLALNLSDIERRLMDRTRYQRFQVKRLLDDGDPNQRTLVYYRALNENVSTDEARSLTPSQMTVDQAFRWNLVSAGEHEIGLGVARTTMVRGGPGRVQKDVVAPPLAVPYEAVAKAWLTDQGQRCLQIDGSFFFAWHPQQPIIAASWFEPAF